MTPEQYIQSLSKKSAAFKNYAAKDFPVRSGNIALRFIDNNFATQGFTGRQFVAWRALKKPRPGKILIKSGTLRRNNLYSVSPGQVRIYNDTPYARVHNEGFQRTVNIRAYQRKNFKVKALNTGRLNVKGRQAVKNVHDVSGAVNVRAHTRNMNIPQRQFMPISLNDSAVLQKQLIDDMTQEIQKIFK